MPRMQRFIFEIIDMQGFEIAEQQYRSRHYCINCGIFSGTSVHNGFNE